MTVCAKCGQENPAGARFCNACAAALESAPSLREQRKTVTVLFCDVTGSTSLGESTDPEALRALLARYFERMKGIVESHGGTVEKFIGDAVMAVFGVPQVHEDDALRAVRAAVEMRDALPELGVQARIGVSTGEVVTGTAERLATGDAVNVAARLEQAAAPGEILIGEETLQLVREAVDADPAEPLELKGKAEPVLAHRLLAAGGGLTRRHEAPIVGRERELQALRDAFARAAGDRSCQLFTVLGSAGVGKSRLATEFLGAVDATIVAGRCLPYGEGITYWPVVEVIKQLPEQDLDPTVERALDSVLGDDTVSPADDIAWAFRKLLEAAAGERPLVVVFDDLHWGEETFLDLVEHVADLSREASILLLCMARPDLLDRRPAWAGGKLNTTTVLLEPLSADEAEALIEGLTGELSEEVERRVIEAAEGNPLFVEEMVALAQGSGEEDIAVPPTIHALLAARLDQLDPSERGVLERGAVEGRVFHRGAVQALAPDEQHVTKRLTSLVRKELVRPDKAHFLGEDAFRFRHLLIRDAAYDALPKAERANLHARFALWLQEHGAELVELDEILGYHLEQAVRYRAELGRTDESLARRAAERLASAGRRAQLRADSPAAVGLLDRSAALLSSADPDRASLLSDLGAALTAAGDLARADTTLVEAASQARASGDHRGEALARLYRAHLRTATDPDYAHEEARGEIERVIASLEELGDHAALSTAWQYYGMFKFWDGSCTAASSAYERVVEHARKAGEPVPVPWWAVALHTYGPTPAQEAAERCAKLAERVPADRYLQALALIDRAVCAAMIGDVDHARNLRDSGKEMLEELGGRLNLAGSAQLVGWIEEILGDEAAAERALRVGYELSAELGETGYLSTTACDLGEAVYAQGRLDEALALSQEAEQLGAADDVSAQFKWRALRAKVLARQGKHDEAQPLAQEAAELARQTDYIDDSAHVVSSLGEVLELGSLFDEARKCYAEALGLHEQKGNAVDARRTRERLEALSEEAPA